MGSQFPGKMVEVHNASETDLCNGDSPSMDLSFVIVPDQKQPVWNPETSHGDLSFNLQSYLQALSLKPDTHHECQPSEQNIEANNPAVHVPSPTSSLNASLSTASLKFIDDEDKDELLQYLILKNTELKEELLQNNLRLRQQVVLFSNLPKCDPVFKEHKERFAETRSLVLKLQAEKAELVGRINNRAGDECEQLVALNDENIQLKNKIKELHDLQRENATCKEQNTGYVSQIYDLSAQLVDADKTNASQSAEIEQLKSMLTELSDQKQKADTTVERLRVRDQEMTAIIINNEDKMSSLISEIQTLRGDKAQLMVENEAIAIYQAQAEVYQSDFLMERAQQEQLRAELYQLKHDFRQLHHQLEQSQATGSNTGNLAARNLTDRDETPKQFSCLNCPCVFHSMDLLRIHVEDCLQLQW